MIFPLKVVCKIHLGYLANLDIVRTISQSAQFYMTLFPGNPNANPPNPSPQTIVLGMIVLVFSLSEIVLDIMEAYVAGEMEL